ncbi:hypothetical protein AWH48_16980 [Domibacillus aminovorans]|uniref:Uncharacterized protein n=1 Tax=Domibacillus aminovorans TaxID=29332 RepID=A0A177KZ48_9BACI|nr:hypothetical protein [Domibacillus aminovorans]OAH58689.1 hypothetical protein AWH48_16980 [Domibacillus aminovorans]
MNNEIGNSTNVDYSADVQYIGQLLITLGDVLTTVVIKMEREQAWLEQTSQQVGNNQDLIKMTQKMMQVRQGMEQLRKQMEYIQQQIKQL